ncbi:MAG: O-antigen ligase family protein [Thermomicrobiales bacterium]
MVDHRVVVRELDTRVSLLATVDARRAVAVAAASSAALALANVADLGPLSALAVAVVIVLGCLSPVGALAGAIVTLPYFYQPLNLAGQHLAASDLLLLAAAVGTASRLVAGSARSVQAHRLSVFAQLAEVVRTPVVLTAIALALLGGVLVVFPYDAAHRAESLREWRWTLAEPALLLGLLAWHRREGWLPALAAGALIAGGSVASLHALADLAFGGGVSVGGVTRIAGPYPHPNALALMTARIVALALGWAAFDPRVRRWIWPLLVSCALAVAATFSRGAMLGSAVALGLVLINASANVRLAGAVSAGLALLVATIAARDRMLDGFDGGSGSLRLDIWSSALEMIGDRPFLGYGPDQFLYAYLPRYVAPSSWGERFTAHSHNFVLDFWIRLGIIGAAFAVVAAVLVVRATALRMQESVGRSRLQTAALIALTAAFAHGLVDNAYFSHDLAMSSWLLAWLAFGLGSQQAGSLGGVDVARTGVGRGRLHRFASLRQPDRRRL